MELIRLAGLSFVVAAVGLVVAAVAYFDWRAGVLVLSVCLVAAGIQFTRSNISG